VVVSPHASPSERQPAFFSVIAPSVFSRSLGGAGEAVESRHHYHVAGGEFGDKPGEL
jgi:hypothetical protein